MKKFIIAFFTHPLVIAPIVGAIALVIIKYAFEKKDERTMQNCYYSIAHITEHYKYGEQSKSIGSTGGSQPSVDFVFQFNGKSYSSNTNTSGLNRTIKKGGKYLLIIRKDNIKTNIVKFNYPIKDSTDF
ncbi:hypothetical protein K4L44_04775 [Halosquirtibacter laminarini]|uniref:Uncharacterized protein n=1 Tax=Halosquirtibacter laminarini TaxID=3374600 RepID=A0AC61NHJ5_9BACT|nr:hypothetical protein K4L44_04775 [Prolixibacteraceae bacterium]